MPDSTTGPRSLRTNFAWALLGNIGFAAAQFAMLLVLARLGSPEVVGRFSLGLAVGAPLVLLSNLSLRQVQATDQKAEFTYADYLGLRLLTSPAAVALIALVALTVYPEHAGVVAGIGLAKGFEAWSDLAHGQYLQQERNDRMALSQLLRGAGALTALAVGVGALGSLELGVAGMALAWGLAALVDLRTAGRMAATDGPGPRWVADRQRALVLTALPLGVVTLFGSLQDNVPRYLIEWHHGTEALGLYTPMASILVAGNLVITALGLTASPRLARLWATGAHREFLALLLRILGIAVLMGALTVTVAAVAGEWILALLFGPAFAAEAHVLVWLAGAAAVTYLYVFLGSALNAQRRFRVQVPLHASSLTVVVVLCALLVPDQGLLGAARAVLGGACTGLLVSLGIVASVLVPALRQREP